MLTNVQKRQIENIMLGLIRKNSSGLDTRILISKTLQQISQTIPNANSHHVSGMIAWLLTKYNYILSPRTLGYSVIK